MDFKNLKMQEPQTTKDSVSFVCDINTGICGPVSTDQATIEPINIDFLNNQQDESEDKE